MPISLARLGYTRAMKWCWQGLVGGLVAACSAPAGSPLPPAVGVADGCGGDAPIERLQRVVDDAPDGATIPLCPGTYFGPLVIRRDLHLVGPATLVGGAGPAVHILSGHVWLDHLTLSGGSGAPELRLDGDHHGGVVAAWDAQSLTITDSTVADGTSDWGGCISGPRAGPLVLRRTEVAACTANKVAGAVWMRHGVLEDSRIADSVAPYGGGLAVRSVSAEDGDVTLVNTVVEGNLGTVQGGGLHLTGPAWVEGGWFTGNHSAQGGGGHLPESTGGLRDVLLTENTAGVGGAGLQVSGGSASLVRVELRENVATGDDLADGRGVGGGIWYAGVSGGGLWTEDVVLADNVAAWGGGVMVAATADLPLPRWVAHGGDVVGHSGGALALVSAEMELWDVHVAHSEGGGLLLDRGTAWLSGGAWQDNTPADVLTPAGEAQADGRSLVCTESGCVPFDPSTGE